MNNVKSSKANKDMAVFSKSYLLFYNSVQTCGWSYILFQAVKFLIKNKSVEGLWSICGPSLLIFQSLAALEVLHCILGLVPSNAVVTFLQVASRVIQVWGIMLPVEKVQNSPTFALTVLAWGITEVVRYSFYCSNLMGKPPKFITWCRYSLFFVLYPAGVIGEVGDTLIALDFIKKRQLFSLLLPNPMNISFNYYYATILMMLTYVPIFPQLFGHMVRQRKKVLGGGSK